VLGLKLVAYRDEDGNAHVLAIPVLTAAPHSAKAGSGTTVLFAPTMAGVSMAKAYVLISLLWVTTRHHLHVPRQTATRSGKI